MTNNSPPGKKLTPQEKLAQFRANAQQITQPAVKKTPPSKPVLNLNPPAPGSTIRRQQVVDAAAQLRNPIPTKKAPTPSRPAATFKKVAAPPTLAAGAPKVTTQQQALLVASKEKTASLQAKRDFAKAAAQRPTPAFNRAARITKSYSR